MPLVLHLTSRHLRLIASAITALILITGCASKSPAIQRPAALADDAVLEQGLRFATDDLLSQALKLPTFQAAQKNALETKLNKLVNSDSTNTSAKPLLIIDNTIEGISGQQTAGTRLIDERLLQLMKARLSTHEVAAVDTENVNLANFVVTGTLTQTKAGDRHTGFKIDISLTDLRSGFVIAQTVARIRPTGVDETPTRFYRESPAISKDRAVEGQIKTAQTRVGEEADGLYLSRLPIAALVAEGDKQFEAGRCSDALKFYDAAASRPEGQQLHVLNGIYLCQTQLGRADAAETTFSHIVALGLATNNLSVKFLFRAGSVEFIPDTKINLSYTMWLRQIAKETATAKACLLVIGHTSKTGTEATNSRLSLQRGAVIQKRLETLMPDLSGRLQSVGMGFKENLVGTGTDDMRDALDRRVEFKVRPC